MGNSRGMSDQRSVSETERLAQLTETISLAQVKEPGPLTQIGSDSGPGKLGIKSLVGVATCTVPPWRGRGCCIRRICWVKMTRRRWRLVKKQLTWLSQSINQPGGFNLSARLLIRDHWPQY